MVYFHILPTKIIILKNINNYVMFLKVRFILFSLADFCLGTECFQCLFVGSFIINKSPLFKTNEIDSKVLSSGFSKNLREQPKLKETITGFSPLQKNLIFLYK